MTDFTSALANIRHQLHQLQEKSMVNPGLLKKNLESIQVLYSSIFNVLRKATVPPEQQNTVDIFTPLVQLVCVASSKRLLYESRELSRLLACAFWLALTDTNVQKLAVPIYPIFRESVPTMLGALSDDDNTSAPGVGVEMSYFRYSLHTTVDHYVDASHSRLALHEMHAMRTKVDSIFGILCTYERSHKPDRTVFEALMSLLELLVATESKDLCVLFVVAEPSFLSHVARLESETKLSSHNRKCTKKLLSVVTRLLLPKYSSVYLRHQDLLPEMGYEKDLLPLAASPADSDSFLRGCLSFVLELLDHGTNLTYLDDSKICDKLLLTTKEIREATVAKTLLYRNFNHCSSKVSLATALVYLNYLLTLNLMSTFEIRNIASAIYSNFQQFTLAPLARTSTFSGSSLVRLDDFGIDLSKSQRSANYKLVLLSLILNLESLCEILEDEFKSFQFMSNLSNEGNEKKFVFMLMELTLSSMVATMMYLQANRKSGHMNKTVKSLVLQTIKKLVSLDLRGVQSSLLWVCLFNFSNDVCYSDICFLSVFEEIFSYLVSEDASVLEDGLILSGLEFFKSTFNYGYQNVAGLSMFSNGGQNVVYRDISLKDYSGSLYERSPSKASRSLSSDLELVSTADTSVTDHDMSAVSSRSNYITNSARKQSVHVDQFGK